MSAIATKLDNPLSLRISLKFTFGHELKLDRVCQGRRAVDDHRLLSGVSECESFEYDGNLRRRRSS